MKEKYTLLAPKFISMNYLQRDRFLIENVTYDFWNMFIITDGVFTLGEENDIVRAGDVVLFSPHKQFARKVVEPISFLSIHFEWDGTNESGTTDEVNPPFGKLSYKDKRRILSTANLMQAALSDEERDHFLKDIWRQFCIESYKNTALTQNKTVNSALDIINEDPTAEISIADIAGRLNISHAHLINLFKGTLGMTPSDYVTSLRIQKAKSLLIDSEYGMQKISELCGFANLYYFSSVFKKSTGLPPTLFRKIYRA